MKKKNDTYANSNELEDTYNNYQLDKNIKVVPTLEAVKIITLYTLFGVLWIFLSDYLLGHFVQSEEIRTTIQLYKGWLYVVITAIVFFLILNRRINLVKQSAEKIIKAYKSLESANIRLEKIAYTDSLTGFPNRNYFEKKIKKRISEHGNDNEKFAVVLIDIDNFRHINDLIGSTAGDRLLTDYSLMFSDFADYNDIFARIGGDEFGFVFKYNKKEAVFAKIASILKVTERVWECSDIVFFITTSIGVSLFPEHGDSFNSIMKAADTALYHAKDTGKNCYAVFREDMIEDTIKYINLSAKINNALENSLFELKYQPVLEFKTGLIYGMEALVRLPDGNSGFIPPYDFIPFAEDTGLIFKIDEWVIKNACRQKKEWNEKGFKDIKLMINLSGKSLSRSMISDFISSNIIENGLSFAEIEFEITETAVIDNFEDTINVLNRMKVQGINVTLDDFGIGYSSLTYLQKLPIDIVKIDRKFLTDIRDSSTHSHVFKAVVELAHELNLKVVAEGIETFDQMEFVKKHNCDYVQGFFFDEPLSHEEIEKIIISKKKYL